MALLRANILRGSFDLGMVAMMSAGNVAMAQTTPPVVIRPPSSAENPAPPPVTSTEVPPVTTNVPDRNDAPGIPERNTSVDLPGLGADPTSSPIDRPAVSPQMSMPSPEVSSGQGIAQLPAPSALPLAVDPANDPVLRTAFDAAPREEFLNLVRNAVARHPALDETAGFAQEARYALYQQEAALAPSAEVNIIGFQVVDRQFAGESIDNIVERTRPDRRFDTLATVNQLVTDFGATSNRVHAAGARLRASALGVDSAAEQIALNTIATWYDVYSLRTILAITRAYRTDQAQARSAIEERIQQGAAAEVDAALVENSIAQLDIRAARFQQQLDSAEARFRELTGAEPPPGLIRAPELGEVPASVEIVRAEAEETPEVRAARLQALAAEFDAKATERDLLPSIGVSLNAGRYGLIEERRDYDVVARITLRQRLFGGLPQRAKAADAHAMALDARARRISEERSRDAAIAYSDLQAFDRQLDALRLAYIASRQTRDAVVQRFRYSRGTLFDVIEAGDTFYSAATGYMQALAQRDAARYIVLARTGALLEALAIPNYSLRD
ncbi:TolC family protein [Qipengyuania spongiae]|uniref:TolC family protein n=1 Tax=Qipengyuania spongiae TaxID=2909673 RepID=A0ABY5T5H3_9SPHN|nr:TolC family protein [Qipengyuania spongiae]UVI40869.1 TolC family protein [Qipengyuania spongiae]